MTYREPTDNDEREDAGSDKRALDSRESRSPNPNGMYPLPGGNGFVPASVVELDTARRLASLAKILALVSLVIGGVLLSGAMVVMSAIAYRNSNRLLANAQDEAFFITAQMVKRSAFIAVVISVLAFALNAISMAVMAPVIMEYMQTGDLKTLFSVGPLSGSAGGKESSFWG